MSDLRDKLISSTFPSLLHTTNDAVLPTTGVVLIEDGSGNPSALSLGLSGRGATITGNLTVAGTTNRIIGATTLVGTTIALSSTGNLTLSGITNRITGVSNTITGNTTINGVVSLNGASNAIAGTVTIQGATTVNDNATITGNASITGTTTIGGTTTVNDNLNVVGNFDVTGTTVIDGTTTINDNLNVTGTADVAGLRIVEMDFPTVAVNGQILVGNSSGNVQFTDISNVVSTGPNTYTKTQYLTPTGLPTGVTFNMSSTENSFIGVTLPSTWTGEETVKGGVFFLEMTSILSDVTTYQIAVSPEGPNGTSNQDRTTYPVALFYSSANSKLGVQFQCPVQPATSPTNTPSLWFRYSGTSTGSVSFKLYTIAKQY